MPWSDYFNFSIPPLIRRLYACALPFFIQSAILTRLSGGIDPFTELSDYKRVRRDLLHLLRAGGNAPALRIIRFGAQHVPTYGYDWRQREKWIRQYTELYDRTVPQIEEMASLIMENDPGACIVAMGDHGAGSFKGVWRGGGNPNANMRNRGVEPALVARDLTGTLMALRFPGKKPADCPPITPANLFRLIFDLCESPSLPSETPANSYLHDTSAPHPWLIAKNAMPLKDWVEQNPVARLNDRLREKGEILINSLGELRETAEMMISAGRFAEAAPLLEKGLKIFPADHKTMAVLARLYLRSGKAKECVNLLNDHFNDDGELLKLFTQAMSISGSSRPAIRLLDVCPAGQKMDFTDKQFFKAHLASMDGQLEEAEKYLGDLLAKGFNDYYILANCLVQLAFCMDARGESEKALAMIDEHTIEAGISLPKMHLTLALAAAMCLRSGQYGQMKARLDRIFTNTGEPYATTLLLWKAGEREMAGDIDGALAAISQAAKTSDNPSLPLQTGLLLIRHKMNLPALREEKKKAYAWLHDNAELFSLAFDEAWYRGRYAKLLESQSLSPLNHFMHFGHILGLDPNPLFNTIYYCVSNYDIFLTGYNPLWHFLVCSPLENRSPSLNFNMQAYMARHQEVDWTKTNPLMHFLALNGSGGKTS